MALYERLLGLDGFKKVSVHSFMACLAEFQRGRITQAEAAAALALDPADVAEVATLLGTFSGTLTAKLQRALEVHDVLLLAEAAVPPYDTVLAVKARLGV